MRFALSLLRNQTGAAAAEMALVTPMLLALMFTCMEGGYYFYIEHQIVKGVRDGARYAARQGFSNYDSTACSSGSIASSSLVTSIKNVTVYGKVSPASGDKPRVSTWTVPDTTGQSVTTIKVTCPSTSVSGSGIYSTLTYSPVVTVSAKVRYPSLFGTLTGLTTAFNVGAADQAAVMGV